jgi:hypothetical protein
MALWKGEDREVMVPDKKKEHRRRTKGPAFGSRDTDEIARADRLEIHIVCGVHRKGEPLPHDAAEKKRRGPLYQEKIVGAGLQDHARSTSSD